MRTEYKSIVDAGLLVQIDDARAASVLGASVLGSSFAFDVEVVRGEESFGTTIRPF